MRIPPLDLSPRLSYISWRWIEIFTLGAVFFLPFAKSVSEICVVLSLTLWILRKFPFGEKFPSTPLCGGAYAVFFLWTVLSLSQVSHENLATGLHGIAKWLKFLGIFFLSLDYFRDTKRTERFTQTFLASMLLACLDGFYQMAADYDLVKHYSAYNPGRFARMQGPFPSPNDLAAFLLPALPLAFFLWKKEERWRPKSVMLAGMMAIFGVSFAATLSRGAFLALALSAAFYAICTQKKRVLWLVALVPALFLASPLLRYNFFGSLTRHDITIRERLHLWHVAWDMIRRHPWTGNGVNLFAAQYASFAEPLGYFSKGLERYRGYAHNSYLQMAAEIGLPGLLAFVIPFLILLPKEILKKSPKPALLEALLVGIPAFLVQSALDTNFYALQTAMLFWWLWGMTITTINGNMISPPLDE